MATDPACLEAIRALAEVIGQRKISYVIIGGTALQLRYGITAVRATADVDTIVLVGTWQEYDDLVSHLDRQGWKADQEHEYRRYAPGGCIVDLLPFPYHEAGSANAVTLPRSKGKLVTIGWVEAVLMAEEMPLAPLGVVRIPPPQHLAAIKAVAWYERGATRDAYDFVTVCRQFGTDDALITEVTAGRAANAAQARAILLANAIASAVPAAMRAVGELGRALADAHGALVPRLRVEFERQADPDEFGREMADIGGGLIEAP